MLDTFIVYYCWRSQLDQSNQPANQPTVPDEWARARTSEIQQMLFCITNIQKANEKFCVRQYAALVVTTHTDGSSAISCNSFGDSINAETACSRDIQLNAKMILNCALHITVLAGMVCKRFFSSFSLFLSIHSF